MNARVLLLFQALLVAVDLSVQSCGPSASPSPAPRTFGLAPIAAHLQFSQVGNTPATGQSGAAYVAIQPTGPSATPANIVAGNGTNTGVARWTYYLLDVPVGSALTSSSLVPAQDGSLSTFTIPETPVIEGTYRVGLTVFDNRGNQASDVRDVVVPTYAKGLLIPSYLSDNAGHNYPIPAVAGTPQPRGWMPDLVAWAIALDTASGGSTPGAVTRIRFAVGVGASQSSVTSIPAGAVVSRVVLDVTTPYSGGATISVGQTGSAALLMATGDNTPQTGALYEAEQDTPWGGSALPVLVTVGGAPGAGAGTVTVDYCTPNP